MRTLQNRQSAGVIFRPMTARASAALRFLVWQLCLPALMLGLGASLAPAEIWVDASGQHKTEAEFLGVKAGKVYLKKKSDGAMIAVPYTALSAESQQLARRLAGAAMGAKPGAATDTPDAAARAVVAGLESGNLRVVWDALPASYQKDVNELIRTFAANMDPDLWKGGTDIVKKVQQILETKKTFILAYPAVAPHAEQLKPNYDKIVDVLKAIVASELADLSKLKTFEMSKFVDGSGKKIMDKLAALAKEADQAGVTKDSFGVPVPDLPDLKKVKFTTVSMDGDSAKLRIEEEGKDPQEHEAVRIEGKWLPKDMAAGWSEGIAAAKAKLGSMGPELQKNKQQAMAPLAFVNMVLGGILAAKTQEEFNQAIDTLKNLAGGAMAGPGAGGAGPGGAGPGGPGPGAPPPGTKPVSSDP